MKSESAISGVSNTMAANLTLIGLLTVRSVLTARLLGPDGRGELTAITIITLTLAAIGLLGLTDSTIYFVSKKIDPLNLIVTNWLILLPVAVFLMGIGYLIIPFFMTTLSGETIFIARLFLLTIPLIFISRTAIATHRGLGNFSLRNGLRLIYLGLYTAVLPVLWLLGITTSSGVALSWIVVDIISTIMFVWSLKRYGSILKASFQRKLVSPSLKYGIQSALGNLPVMLNDRLDQLIMIPFLGVAQLGLYAIAVSWSIALLPISNALVVVMFPYVAQAQKEESAGNRFAATARIGLLITILLCLSIFVVTPVAVPLIFGTDFQPAVPAAMILTIGAIPFQYNRILREGLKGMGFPIAGAIGEGTGLAATVILLFLFLPRYGILGAAITSLIAYSISCIVLLWFTNAKTDIKLYSLIIPKRNDLRIIYQYVVRWMTQLYFRLRNRNIKA